MHTNPNNPRRKAVQEAQHRGRIKNHVLGVYIRARLLRKSGRGF